MSIAVGLWVFLTLVTVFGLAIVIRAKQVVMAFLGALVTMFALGLLFMMAGAEFVAASQIMIYVGGILVLLAFGLMVSPRNMRQEAINEVSSTWGSALVALSVVSCLALGAYEFITSQPIKAPLLHTGKEQVNGIGYALMTTHALPLEIAGLLLLAATIGALVLTRLGKQE